MTCKDCIHFEVCDSERHIGEYIEDKGKARTAEAVRAS